MTVRDANLYLEEDQIVDFDAIVDDDSNDFSSRSEVGRAAADRFLEEYHDDGE